MNLILLFPTDFIRPCHVQLMGRRAKHMLNIQRAKVGSTFCIELVNDKVGTGTVTEINSAGTALSMDIVLHYEPSEALNAHVVLALPRSNMLSRILQTCATMGVKEITLLNSQRVEKSFWQSPVLNDSKVREQFVLGLEQAKDTHMPQLSIEKCFTTFIKSTLPKRHKKRHLLMAYPGKQLPHPTKTSEPTTVLIGPEGGFLPDEVEQFQQAGGKIFQLGGRILRVETAVPVILSHLFPLSG